MNIIEVFWDLIRLPFLKEDAQDPTEQSAQAKAKRDAYSAWYKKNEVKIKANMKAGKLDIYEGINTAGFIDK